MKKNMKEISISGGKFLSEDSKNSLFLFISMSPVFYILHKTDYSFISFCLLSPVLLVFVRYLSDFLYLTIETEEIKFDVETKRLVICKNVLGIPVSLKSSILISQIQNIERTTYGRTGQFKSMVTSGLELR